MVVGYDNVHAHLLGEEHTPGCGYSTVHGHEYRHPLLFQSQNCGLIQAVAFTHPMGYVGNYFGAEFTQTLRHHCRARDTIHVKIPIDAYGLARINSGP